MLIQNDIYTMQPLGNRIVVIPGKVPPLKSGLVLPENSTDLREGEVIFIGTKTKTIKIGDKVLYENGIGTALKYEGKDVFIADEGQIKGIVR